LVTRLLLNLMFENLRAKRKRSYKEMEFRSSPIYLNRGLDNRSQSTRRFLFHKDQ